MMASGAKARQLGTGEMDNMISTQFSGRRWWLVVAALLVIWGALGAGLVWGVESKAAMDKLGMVQIEEDVVAPDFTVTTVNGDVIKLSSMKGKVVLLNFWATW